MDPRPAGNRQSVREFNTHLLLDTIKNAGSISHADITRKTGLSGATVSSIIKYLKKGRFVRAGGAGKSDLGRKPTLLHFNPEARLIIGASFLAEQTRVGVLDLAGRIMKAVEFPTNSRKGPKSVFKTFGQRVQNLISDVGIPRERYLGVGVGFEGVVDNQAGVLLLSARLGWRDVPVRDEIQKRLALRTVVDSEGAAMALAEHKYGVGRGLKHIICVDIDAGIGSAVLMNGQVCHGSHKMAGEIGHTTVVKDGPECKCGKRGCLESVASGAAIISKVREGLASGIKSMISNQVLSAATNVAVNAIFKAAKEGDTFARQIIEQAGDYLGLAIAGVINYADPDLVVLTGCVTDESEGLLLQIVHRQTEKYVLDSGLRTIDIKAGVLGDNAILMGAGVMVYGDAFRLPAGY